MDKKNILRLSNSSYIEFEFNIKLRKYQVLNLINYKYDITCFKIADNYDEQKFRYKIVSSYFDKLCKCNLNIVEIIEVILPYLDNPITLIINKNYQPTLMLKLMDLDCFENIIFGKQFDVKNHNFACMKNITNVMYTKRLNSNLLNLPQNLNVIKIRLRCSEFKLIEIPSNTHKLFIFVIGSEYCLLNMEDVKGIKKILFVDNWNEIKNSHTIEYDCLVMNYDNLHIDFTNLPFTLKILYLHDGFNKCLDYLPSSVEKIIFAGTIGSNLSDLPSSVKSIEFRCFSFNQIDKLKELPDTIETIYLMCNGLNESEPIKYLPKKLCLVKIELLQPNSFKISFIKNYESIIRSIENYKRENNLNFVIEFVEQSISSMKHTLNSIYKCK